MNAVPRHANDALYQVQSRLRRRGKNGDVAAVDLTVRHEKPGESLLARWRETVNKHVVADQQILLHGRGTDLKLLAHEGKNAQRTRKYPPKPGYWIRIRFVLLWFCFFRSSYFRLF